VSRFNKGVRVQQDVGDPWRWSLPVRPGTLLIVSGLADPAWLVEIEATAAKA